MGLFFAILFAFSSFFWIVPPLSAQSLSLSPDGAAVSDETGVPDGTITPGAAGVDESAIIIGETPVAPAPAGGSSVFLMLRMILVLALAALAIYGIVFFIKRLSRPQESRDPHLKVLAKVPLSSDAFAAVLSVGARAWLVAGGSGGVNPISEIDDAESLETMLLDDARRTAEAPSGPFIDFRSLIKRLGGGSREKASGGSNKGGGSLADNGSLAENLRRQRERLRGL